MEERGTTVMGGHCFSFAMLPYVPTACLPACLSCCGWASGWVGGYVNVRGRSGVSSRWYRDCSLCYACRRGAGACRSSVGLAVSALSPW